MSSISADEESRRNTIAGFMDRGNGPIFLHARIHFNYATRPEVSPGKFFFSCPDNFNRLLRFLCQACRFNGRFTTVLSTIISRAVQLSDADEGTIYEFDEVALWQRTLGVQDVLAQYRARYTPTAGSPATDAGDPVMGAGNDIGAIGSGTPNPADQFGR